jgi:hypothetical protein
MTRSKELRRIEAAIAHRNEAELRWALAAWELRKKAVKMSGGKWKGDLYQIEKQIRRALQEIEDANSSDGPSR